ncbi:Putative Purine catabolism PurC [Modestobacter italicus]|uniref:Purine catabolism PurC n=1 Tax=Modestobacter italicus (strain DSM 44449 / CECT 9708 / BC 501) TaxID=2732864 RepID=I4F1P0_MODI5|nr:PucR family transcriptional regulator [Modestobacter marinus]CCH89553.1 Putative Purine catabolism PurC [Modestobacter marinus]
MPFTLRDLLALPAVQGARPELAGHRDGIDDRVVRWVHTSEIQDIAPLLKGGEALLTTGLGLVALPPEAHRAYAAALARVGLTALLLELGRSFPTAPPALLDEAARVGLPVVLLHGVVPFIEVTEAAHAAILEQEVTALREVAEQRNRLLQAMAESPGVIGLVGACAQLSGQPASLVTADGELVAGSADAGAGDGVDVLVGGRVWGRLALLGPAGPRTRATMEAAGPLVALEVQRSPSGTSSRRLSAAQLLTDLITGRYSSSGDLASRALGVGFVVRPGHAVIGCVVRPRSHRSALPGWLQTVQERSARHLPATMVAERDGHVLLGAAVPRAGARRLLAALTADLNARLGAMGGVLVCAGPLVDDVPALAGSLQSAVDTSDLAVRMATASDLVLSEDVALYQLLLTMVDDAALERFTLAQLGPLLQHDARTGAGLVMTLDTLFVAGMSKSRAADMLGVRRQTLYGRVERISQLLGGVDLEQREIRTALDLALLCWRLRLNGGRAGTDAGAAPR